MPKELIQMDAINFQKACKSLKFFSALPVTFDPETPFDAPDFYTVKEIIKYSQHIDYLLACQYTETILEEIADNKTIITPAFILKFIKKIHTIIAKALRDHHNITTTSTPLEPGEYLGKNHGCIRWHKTTSYAQSLIDFIVAAGPSPEKDPSWTNEADTLTIFQDFFAQSTELGITKAELLALSREIKHLKTTHKFTDRNGHTANEKEIILALLSQDDKVSNFTPPTQTVIRKMYFTPPSSDKIPNLMEDFSKRYASTWQEHLKNCPSIEVVAQTAAQMFKELTCIHPFFNCNGRMATLFVNSYLCSLGYSCILIRLPGERKNADCLYSKAVAAMETDISLLTQLFLNKLQDPSLNSSEKVTELRTTLPVYVEYIQLKYTFIIGQYTDPNLAALTLCEQELLTLQHSISTKRLEAMRQQDPTITPQKLLEGYETHNLFSKPFIEDIIKALKKKIAELPANKAPFFASGKQPSIKKQLNTNIKLLLSTLKIDQTIIDDLDSNKAYKLQSGSYLLSFEFKGSTNTHAQMQHKLHDAIIEWLKPLETLKGVITAKQTNKKSGNAVVSMSMTEEQAKALLDSLPQPEKVVESGKNKIPCAAFGKS